MPIIRGKDSKGPYYMVENFNNRYYYTSGDKSSREEAYNKALRQLQAYQANKAKRKNKKYTSDSHFRF